MDSLTELVNEMHHLIDAANKSQIHLRAFGGLAILAQSQKDPRFFKRDAPDLDFLIPKNERQKLEPFFHEMGYSPDRQFNLLNGMRRQIYYSDRTHDLHVDILVGDFEMCHKLPLDNRLEVDPVTIPLAELLLSKAQVVQLNRKDALDIISLLFNHEVGEEKDGRIGLDRITQLCGQDWGLYKTTSINLGRVEELLAVKELNLTPEERGLVVDRIRRIQKAFADMPKSVAWQMRDKVGTRVRWYLEVEEVDQ
ncbi:MAG: nucleotidyltransferase family protein [Anaerolineae bacterium]|nr:nucleotidyltransferase family protein [Anaerolineae bacterium]